MSQAVFSSINPATTSGNQLASLLNDFKNAMMSGLSGTSRPSQTTAGGGWIDTSQEGSPNFLWSYKVYTGTVDVEVFKINLATNTASIAGTDSLFEVTKISADSAGPILKFIKQRVADSGKVLSGDTILEIQAVGRTADPTNPLVGRMRYIAMEDQTSVASGSYFVLEGTKAGEATISEFARFYNGLLGIGVTAPTFGVHLRSQSGIKSERVSDDAVGPRDVSRKARIAGSTAVQSGDVLKSIEFNSTDDAPDEFLAAQIEVKATQNHTAAARGTSLSFKTTATGGTTPTEQLFIGDKVEAKNTLVVEGLEQNSQDIASAATIAALNADKSIVNITGATATTLQGISATGKSKTITIHNRSSANLTISNENGSATAANRFTLPNALDIVVEPNSSIEFFYRSADSRWRLKSGSGSGGGSTGVSSTQTLAGAAVITLGAQKTQRVKIQSTGGEVTVTLPNGADDGNIVYVQGMSDTNYCVIADTGNVSCNGNISFTNKVLKQFMWDSGLTQWILVGGY